jgi:hypothetical protein
MVQHFGGTVKVNSAKACVVYQADNGRVHHVHHAITLEGGREPSEGEMENHVLNLVRQRGVTAANLQVLHVAREAIEPGTVYVVDPTSRSLVVKRKVQRGVPGRPAGLA